VQRGASLGPNTGKLCAAIGAVESKHAPVEFAVRRVSALLRATTQQDVDHVERAYGVAIDAGAPTWRCVRAWLLRDLIAYRDIAARLAASANATEEPDTKETA